MDTKKKTRQTWKRDLVKGLVSIVTKNNEGKETNRRTIADATELFPEYDNFGTQKRDIILYGIEQRVCDKLASQKEKTFKDYEDVYGSILDGSFYQKKKVSRLTITKKAEAIKDTLSADNITLLKKLGILK